jgi:hypothetical protein
MSSVKRASHRALRALGLLSCTKPTPPSFFSKITFSNFMFSYAVKIGKGIKIGTGRKHLNWESRSRLQRLVYFR